MPENFLFHEVSEKEKQEIKKQAKKIMDDFSKKLSKIKEDVEEPLIEREEGERRGGDSKCEDNFSRDIMFENAPSKNKDFIVGEKKGW